MTKKVNVLMLIIIFFCLMLSRNINETKCSDTLFEHYNVDDNSNISIRGVYWGAQTFTVGSQSHSVTSIKLKLCRYGSSTGNFEISIRNTDNHLPTGNDLTFGSITGSSITTSSGLWYEITMNTVINLTAYTEYAIVCRYTTGDGSHYINWRNGLNGLPNNQPCTSSNSGSTWSSAGTTDYMFEVYGNPIYYVTQYFSNGGKFLVNGILSSNGSINTYNTDTISFVGSPDSQYSFISFNWTDGNTTVNYYNYTLTDSITVWCYFDYVNSTYFYSTGYSTGYSTSYEYFQPLAVIIAIIISIIVILMVDRRILV